MQKTRIFETERLYLRPTSIEDDEFVYKLFNSPKSLQFIGDRKIENNEIARVYIEEKMLPQLQKLGFSSYTVIRKSDEEKIGVCGLYDREGLEGIDLGFGFLPEFEGQGYAHESTLFLLKMAKHYFHLNELSAITVEENSGSRKILQI
jgi:[ribosomal protein S5]-alanine N-acetyltransferase